MSDLSRGFPSAPVRGQDALDYRIIKGMLAFWDISANPSDNSNRAAKLGVGDRFHGVAIGAYDAARRANVEIDGFKMGNGVNSWRMVEPDNWTPRFHDRNTVDNVWSIRMVCDHENVHSQKAHRSTMVLDQCGTQNWAWLADLAWVKKLGASCSSEELAYDAAGFLSILRGGTPTGGITRAALMLNVCKRAGYFTDGADVGQAWHVLSMRKGLNTIPAPGPGDCGAVIRNQLALRGDVNFHMGSSLVHLAVASAFETSGYIYSGQHWVHTPAPAPPANELSSDQKSNQPILPRTLEKGLWVFIRQGPPVATPTGIPPMREFTPPAGAAVIDIKTLPSSSGGQGGGFTFGSFPPGLNTDEYLSIGVPEVGNASDLRVMVTYMLSVLITGVQQIELALVYKLLGPDGTVPSAPTMITKVLTIADNPSSVSDMKTLDFTIPNFTNGLMRGGSFVMQLFRRGREATDTFPGTFKQVNNAKIHIKPRG